MILIPELQVVVLLTPRTGSGSLRRAIAETYPRSMLVYRHMEADGVPHGYDRWTKVGVVRHPIDRLWSLYKFLQNFGGNHDPAYIAAQRASVDMPFSQWIVTNQTVFTAPYDSAGWGHFYPQYTVNHPLPETRKSQFLTLRPDLGTVIFRFDELPRLAQRLGVTLATHNTTEASPRPPMTMAALEHCHRYFEWDFKQLENPVAFAERQTAFAPQRLERAYA